MLMRNKLAAKFLFKAPKSKMRIKIQKQNSLCLKFKSYSHIYLNPRYSGDIQCFVPLNFLVDGQI